MHIIVSRRITCIPRMRMKNAPAQALAYESMIQRVLAVHSLLTLLHLQLASASEDQPVTWR